ncbi:MAG TPA: amidohydrolase family protein [Candidatus Acidoferrales bacterium]|nr:amidohydrolase family protein [Candidatus Acidoferrales bacterium]
MINFDRRRFLTSALTSLAVAAIAGGDQLAAFSQSTAPATKYRIDVHHHFAPPTWVAAMKGNPLLQTANTTWTPEKSIEDLDRGNGAAAVLSITNPGLYLGDKGQAIRLARECNDFGAKVVQAHPTRFGLFAAMPLPDVDATLKEVAYAYDQIHADGIGFMTSFGDTWLGNPAYRPVMEELNRRNAVVFVHPTAADCCRNLNYATGVHPASMEYGTDTTRAITGVCFSGDAVRFPNIRWIWSHGGGTMPFLAGRIGGAARNFKQQLPNGLIAELKKFYYDLAGAGNAGAVASLKELVSSDKILFGTDFPPGGHMLENAQTIRELNMFSEADLKLIDRDNVVRLLPRLQMT